MRDTIYFKQVELLIRILPLIAGEKDFALKGGTAINFFHRNMPRISVDIDLTYLPLTERKTSMENIEAILKRIKSKIESSVPGTNVFPRKVKEDTIGLIVDSQNAVVKIEPNLVIRGTVFPTEQKRICDKAAELFEVSIKMKTLGFADLFGGKICAALDRQHPRDLFDVKLLLENERITNIVRQAFIVYLISHSRPIIELLNPNFIDIKEMYEKEFKKMTEDDVSLDELIHTREILVKKINNSLNYTERQFILSVKKGEPEWGLMNLDNIQNLPGVRWKLKNIERMSKVKRQEAFNKLQHHLLD